MIMSVGYTGSNSFPSPGLLTAAEAYLILNEIQHSKTNLADLAAGLGVTITRVDVNGKVILNKGWAGEVIERLLNVPRNQAQCPDLVDAEIKVVAGKYLKSKKHWVVKETMAVTMITPDIASLPFEESHLLNKLQSLLIAVRTWKPRDYTESHLLHVVHYRLEDHPEDYLQMKSDYELIQTAYKERGLAGLSSRMGVIIQPRTKGPGVRKNIPETNLVPKLPTRAFYCRTSFMRRIASIDPLITV